MRFLCLHGMGTNAEVYKAQVAPILANVDPTHEFFFPDGLIECPPPPAVPTFFKGPFYCFYAKPTEDQIKTAYEYVHELIEEEGPFDGIMGFSQGGALAASLLLHHRKVSPFAPDLFKLAVFTCASLPFDPDSDTRPDKYSTIIDPDTGVVRVADFEPADSEPSEINGFIVPLEDGDVIMRRYHPDRETARIQIPTVHIMGKNDPFLPQCQALAQLCGPDQIVLVHEGRQGHYLPRDQAFAAKAAASVHEGIARAMFRH